jgi:hypothetical protein
MTYFRHGDATGGNVTLEYKSWRAMKARCLNPRHPFFRDYGGRSVKICERWQDFRNFLADMGRKPGPEYTLERINNDADYSPENCKWATRTQQQANRRPQKNRTGYPNVWVDPKTGRFMGVLRTGGKTRWCGTYGTPQEASEAAQRARALGR